ncbi:MAG TPA: PIN domain-containing protein [Candidatus Limnocylindria bacterium]|nr:PIN domain-containing protein [Candidatus Limnocylindria bacterium]
MTPAPLVAYADTNLFVALFATDEHPSHAAALRLFQRVAEGALRLIVTPMVLAEIAYVTTSVLRWNRANVAEKLGAMLGADGLEIREQQVLLRTLALYRDVRRLDFADAYLAALALEEGPPVIASFDADCDAVVGLKRIKR